MPILLDWSNVMIGNVMTSIKLHEKSELDENYIRTLLINSLRGYNKKYKRDYGDLVICCDGWKSWRHSVFPYYKAKRKDDREESKIDWKKLYEITGKIEKEIKSIFPYKFIRVNTAEGDDVIGAIVLNRKLGEKFMIISSDKDFIQLHNDCVQQYSPRTKKLIKSDTRFYLKEHIIRGDRSDGIPNFRSPEDCFVKKIKQNTISKKNLEKWLKEKPESFCTEEELSRYKTNSILIDLNFIPEELKTKIVQEYKKPAEGERSKILSYLISNNLDLLIENLGDF